jgi:pimeloyl-ACP methyl ester carboxylesterase
MRPWRPVVSGGLRSLSKLPFSATRDLDEVARIYEALGDRAQRTAVQRVTSHVLNWRGQFVTMTDRSYLARLMPVLVIWGRDDMVIPSSHADLAPTQVSDVHVLEHSGHFPHKDHPEEFARIVMEFVEANEPAHYHRGRWRALLRRGDQYELESVTPESMSSTEPAIG